MCKKAIKSVVKVATLGLVDPDGMKVPDMPKPPAPLPTEQDPAVLAAREEEKRRRAAAAGQDSTILTGSQGLTAPASTAQKTLLGA